MSFFTSLFHQIITYWGTPVPDGYGGSAFDPPVTIIGRWDDKKEVFVDAMGEETISTSVVYTEEPIVVNGYLYLGRSAVTDPTTVTGARKIQQVANTPSLGGDAVLREAWL